MKINLFDIWVIEIDWRAVAAVALAIAVILTLGVTWWLKRKDMLN